MKITSGARTAEVSAEGAHASIDGSELAFRAIRSDGAGDVEAVEIAGVSVAVRTAREGDRVFVWCGGRVYEFRRAAEGVRRTDGADAGHGLVSPMPGRVRRVLVGEGETVTRGQVLLILEAMKMEHSIRSPRDGRVVRIAFGEGDLVDAGVELAEVE